MSALLTKTTLNFNYHISKAENNVTDNPVPSIYNVKYS